MKRVIDAINSISTRQGAEGPTDPAFIVSAVSELARTPITQRVEQLAAYIYAFAAGWARADEDQKIGRVLASQNDLFAGLPRVAEFLADSSRPKFISSVTAWESVQGLLPPRFLPPQTQFQRYTADLMERPPSAISYSASSTSEFLYGCWVYGQAGKGTFLNVIGKLGAYSAFIADRITGAIRGQVGTDESSLTVSHTDIFTSKIIDTDGIDSERNLEFNTSPAEAKQLLIATLATVYAYRSAEILAAYLVGYKASMEDKG